MKHSLDTNLDDILWSYGVTLDKDKKHKFEFWKKQFDGINVHKFNPENFPMFQNWVNTLTPTERNVLEDYIPKSKQIVSTHPTSPSPPNENHESSPFFRRLSPLSTKKRESSFFRRLGSPLRFLRSSPTKKRESSFFRRLGSPLRFLQ